MAETVGQRKVIGAIWLMAAIVSIGAAFAVQPVSDWGFFGYLIAAALVLMGVTGAWMLITGRGQIWGGKSSLKSRRILSIIGIIGATILVLGYLVSDWSNWTANDVLSIGVWVAIGAMFIEGLISTRDA